jgi:hypothetical protein
VRNVLIAIAVMLAACGGPMQTLELVNQTPRPIEAFYVYPHGGDRGASRGSLAPDARTSVQVKAGRIDVYAVSAKYQLDEHTRDRPEASQELEVRGPARVIFYDADSKPAEVARPDVFGVEFSLPKPRGNDGP